ncbi:MAG TPA: DegT/DnrJ/EryC1/StrS family aminotransferase [Planctomycetota bacterium]|nr:DegT/DnrJ/EryC1/StrS family aminotransferase [Planctomycetota bacterium]
MPRKAKKESADFRYETGAARVPWAAVGELMRPDDVGELVRFLLPSAAGKKRAYEARFRRVVEDLKKLCSLGGCAGKLTLGGRVQALEKTIARMLRVKHVLFVANATAGFEIAYKFAGLKPGDEVIAPAITFIASIAYPLSIGAKVVLADVDERTVNLDPRDVAKKVTRKTKVIMPVHIGGYPVDMDPIMQLARRRKITVIEDAAHAFGGVYKGRNLGCIGHFGAFSFHEVKNVTALGEGGILVSNLACGKDFGKSRFLGLDMSRQIRYWLYDVVALKGMGDFFAPGNHSATEIQAVGLASQTRRLRRIIAKRKKAETYLTRRFRKEEGLIPPPGDTAKIKSTHHLYLLRVDPEKVGADVQVLKKKLSDRGVVNVPHFAPLYKFSIMKQLGYDTRRIEKTCPVAERVFRHEFTHLPLYDLSPAQLRYMADAVIDSLNEMKNGR